ncbi:anti-sigma factor [Streptomyces sp. NBC_01571]|uniref:anti-sigma factor n=1 Tax=Streptomyces sp. NBC_01571 TaxID=2975883 RepID=UPI002253D46C|nr:anti-sigma factor [Streptomyces sp. NBC_01571]MCX4572407.1 anti-sigma factor [Streptomyces sp. NBC_01571]
MTTSDLHTLTGAYALYALDADERGRFERHAADCEACVQEVRELTATAARLGLAESAVAAPELKNRVMRQITTVRQEAPLPTPSPPPAPDLRRVRRTRGLSRWALAACVAAAAAFGGTAVWQHERARDAQHQARDAERRTADLTAVLAAPDAKSRTARLAGGAGGTVVVSASRDKAVFISSEMAKPPSGKVYQLWFDDAGTMRSAGLMDPHRTSEAVLLDGNVAKASGMGITVEPAGGSARPTSAPLALLDLPA